MRTGVDARVVSPAARPEDDDAEGFRGSKFKQVLAAGNAVLRALRLPAAMAHNQHERQPFL